MTNADVASSEGPLEIEVPGGTQTFSDLNQLHSWAAEEERFWSWAKSKPARLPLQDDPLTDLFNPLIRARESAASLINNEAGADRGSLLSGISKSVRQYASVGLASQTPIANFISALKDRHGEQAAFAALIYRLGGAFGDQLTRGQRQTVRIATGAIDAFVASVDHALPDSVREATENILHTYHQHLNSFSQSGKAMLEEFRKDNKGISDSCAAWMAEREAQWAATSERINTEVQEALETLNNTHKAYTERMKLRASVEYWDTKAAAHEKRAGELRGTLVKFAWRGGFCLLFSLALIATLTLVLSTAAGPATPLTFFGVALVLTTATMWIARILVRLFLSEHHLGIDARERATMAMTYLALTNEGKISEAERILVLAPLFRPTTDGIVKDDAAPDVSMAGQLSRLAQGR